MPATARISDFHNIAKSVTPTIKPFEEIVKGLKSLSASLSKSAQQRDSNLKVNTITSQTITTNALIVRGISNLMPKGNPIQAANLGVSLAVNRHLNELSSGGRGMSRNVRDLMGKSYGKSAAPPPVMAESSPFSDKSQSWIIGKLGGGAGSSTAAAGGGTSAAGGFHTKLASGEAVPGREGEFRGFHTKLATVGGTPGREGEFRGNMLSAITGDGKAVGKLAGGAGSSTAAAGGGAAAVGATGKVVGKLVGGAGSSAGAAAGGAAAGGPPGIAIAAALIGLEMLAGAAQKVVSTFVSIAEQGLKFYELLSPSGALQFQRALNDLGATLGTAFAPAFEALIPVVRELSASLAPILSEMAPYIKEFATTLVRLLNPLIKFGLVIAAVVLQFASFIMPLVNTFISALNVAVHNFAWLFGFDRASVGASTAVVGGATTSDFSQITHRMAQDAFQASTSPAERTANAATEIVGRTGQIIGIMQNLSGRRAAAGAGLGFAAGGPGGAVVGWGLGALWEQFRGADVQQ